MSSHKFIKIWGHIDTSFVLVLSTILLVASNINCMAVTTTILVIVNSGNRYK